MHGLTEFFLNPYCLLNSKALKHFKLQSSSLLAHSQILIVIILLTRLPLMQAIAILCHIMVNIARSFFASEAIQKLLQQKIQDANCHQVQISKINNSKASETQTVENAVAQSGVNGLDGVLECITETMMQIDFNLTLSIEADLFKAKLKLQTDSYLILGELFSSSSQPLTLKSESLKQILVQLMTLFLPKLVQNNQQIIVQRSQAQMIPQKLMLDASKTLQIMISLIMNQIKSSKSPDIMIQVFWVPNNQTQLESCSPTPWLQSNNLKQVEQPKMSGLSDLSKLSSCFDSSENKSDVEQEKQKLQKSESKELVDLVFEQNDEEKKSQGNSGAIDLMQLGQKISNKRIEDSIDINSVQVSCVLDYDSDMPRSLAKKEQVESIQQDDAYEQFKPRLEDAVQVLSSIKENEDSKDEESSFCDFDDSFEEVNESDQININKIDRSVIPTFKEESVNHKILRPDQTEQVSKREFVNDNAIPYVKLDGKSLAKNSMDSVIPIEVEKNQKINPKPSSVALPQVPVMASAVIIVAEEDQEIMVPSCDPIWSEIKLNAEYNLSLQLEVQVEESKEKAVEVIEVPQLRRGSQIAKPQVNVIAMGETGSNQFDENESKDQDLAIVNSRPRVFGEASEISFVENDYDAHRQGQNAEQSMASLLDGLGTNRSGDDSWISDANDGESSMNQMNKNEEQQKSLFGAYNIINAQGSSDNLVVNPQLPSIPPRGKRSRLPPPPMQMPPPQVVIPAPVPQAPEVKAGISSQVDALRQFQMDAKNNVIKNNQARRQSVCVAMTDKDSMYTPKTIKVRHPLRGRSKSITLPNFTAKESKNFPISRLNNYDQTLKKHRGSIVSMQSSLQSIDEDHEDEDSPKSLQKPPLTAFEKQKLELRQNILKPALDAKQKSILAINSIVNFGHGRRNNLVKIADQINQKFRANSVIITNTQEHLRKLQAHSKSKFCQIEQESNHSSVNQESSAHDSINDLSKERKPTITTNNDSSVDKGQTNGSSSNKDQSKSSESKSKSLFKQDYSFQQEVSKASGTQIVTSQAPPSFQRSRASAMKGTLSSRPSDKMMQSIDSSYDFNKDFSKMSVDSSVPSNGSVFSFCDQTNKDWDQGVLVIQVIDKTPHVNNDDEPCSFLESIDKKFQTSFDLVNQMNGQFQISMVGKARQLTVKLPSAAKVGTLMGDQSIKLKPKQELDIKNNRQLIRASQFKKQTVLLAMSPACNNSKIITNHFEKVKRSSVKIEQYKPQFKQSSETCYVVFYDSSSLNSMDQIIMDKCVNSSGFIIIQIRNQPCIFTPNNQCFIDLSIEEDSLKESLVDIVRTMSFSQVKRKLSVEVKKRDSEKKFNLNDSNQSQESEISLQSDDGVKSPYLEGILHRKSVQNESGQLDYSRKTDEVVDRQQQILSKVNTLSQTQYRYTQVDKVPYNGNVILVIDDNQETRDEVQSLFTRQVNQLHISYISKKLQQVDKDYQDDKLLSKIQKPNVFIVEAVSGEQAVIIFRQLLLQQCSVHLVLISGVLHDPMTSVQIVKRIKVVQSKHNSSHDEASKCDVLVVGHDLNHTSKAKDPVYDFYLEKPFEKSSSRRVISILIGKQKENESTKNKLTNAYLRYS